MRVGERYGTKIWSGGDWGKVDGRLFGFSSGRVWDLWLLYDRDPMRTLTLRIIIIIIIIIIIMIIIVVMMMMMMMMMMIISS